MTPTMIAIAGPSGSGKSTLAQALADQLGHDQCQCLALDNYYRDLRHLSPAERALRDFDHPAAWESELLIAQITALKQGHSIALPQYDFTAHARTDHPQLLAPSPYIILEGLFALCYPALNAIIDLPIFIDIDDNIALERRLQRDVIERGRTRESVIEQFQTTDQPATQTHIRPSATSATLHLTCQGDLAANLARITPYLV
jgi:uridine kinase